MEKFKLGLTGYADGRPHMILCYNDVFVGYYSGHTVEKEHECYYISYLNMLDIYKGKGIAKEFINYIIDSLILAGFTRYIQLESYPNTIAFWEKFGFKVVDKKAGTPTCKVMILTL